MIWRKSENLDFQLFPKQKRPYFLAFVIKVKYNIIYIRPTVQVFVGEILKKFLKYVLSKQLLIYPYPHIEDNLTFFS